jgi:peptide/nickel transport system permease protein
MRRILHHAIRMLLVLVLGGFAGATLVRFAPGYGMDEQDLDARLNAESHAALRASEAQNPNLMKFYCGYWRNLLRGDLGTSIALHEPVRQLLAERWGETAKSMAAGLALAWTLGLGLSLASIMPPLRAVHWASWLIATVVLSIPAAMLAILFVLAQAPARLAVGVIVFPNVYQFSRNLLARSAALPHVLTARAKGVGELRVMFRHILPVTAPQILALFGVSVCMALAACIPVEVLCDMPGIGQLAWKAALSRDLPLLVNLTMIVTLITLLANSGMDMVTAGMRRGNQ